MINTSDEKFGAFILREYTFNCDETRFLVSYDKTESILSELRIRMLNCGYL